MGAVFAGSVRSWRASTARHARGGLCSAFALGILLLDVAAGSSAAAQSKKPEATALSSVRSNPAANVKPAKGKAPEVVSTDAAPKTAVASSEPFYSPHRFFEQTRSVPYEMALVGGAIVFVGLNDWDWGNTSGFKTIDEGWFAKNTRHGGMDKIGHAFGGYVIADLLTDRIRANAPNPAGAEITASLLAFAVMGGVEFVDGFTGKHRFSWQDIASNAVGAAFSAVRSGVPGLRDKIDWRIMYTPASFERPGITPSEFNIIPPYQRQRYVLAVKASGFEPLKKTPMRYFELHVGFEARGFETEEIALNYPIERSFYFGVGVNLNEVLFGEAPVPNFREYKDTLPGWAARKTLEYVQVPYTSIDGQYRFSKIPR